MKKSLFVGMAALGFVAVAGTATANSASAKTYAKVTSNQKMSGDVNSRNVSVNGTNALYTKAGTLRGARVVASKSTLKGLANTNFRAYQVATTNRGSVYYKIVSFDGNTRGWIYGGKSTSKFAGGVAQYATTKDAQAPEASAKFNLTNTSATENTVLYAAPQGTQYKVGRSKDASGSIITNSDKYKNETFTVSKAVTRSRQGDTWYQIASSNADINGAWVSKDNVKSAVPASTEPAATANNSVKVNYIDAANNNTIANADKTFITTATTTKQGELVGTNVNTKKQSLSDFVTSSLPAGYQVVSSPADKAVFGGTLFVSVEKAATSKVTFNYRNVGDSSSYSSLKSDDFANGYPTLTDAQQKVFTGKSGDTVKDSLFATLKGYFDANAATENKIKGFYGKASSTKGKTYFYSFDQDKTKAANYNAKYGDTLKLIFTRYEVNTPKDNGVKVPGNTNFVG